MAAVVIPFLASAGGGSLLTSAASSGGGAGFGAGLSGILSSFGGFISSPTTQFAGGLITRLFGGRSAVRAERARALELTLAAEANAITAESNALIADNNALIMDFNAEQITKDTARNVDIIEQRLAFRLSQKNRQTDRILGAQRALYAKAGVELTSGTPAVVMDETAKLEALDAWAIKYAGLIERQDVQISGLIGAGNARIKAGDFRVRSALERSRASMLRTTKSSINSARDQAMNAALIDTASDVLKLTSVAAKKGVFKI